MSPRPPMRPRLRSGGPCAGRPSGAVQDYVMAVYALETVGGGLVGTRDLAARVRVTAPSAVNMGKRLAALGLAEQAPRRGLRLTPAGRVVARSALRRQRVLETLLIEQLGSTCARAEEDADRLRRVVSDELIERLWVALGRPLRDPRGNPIPAAEAADAGEAVGIGAVYVGPTEARTDP